MTGIRSPTCPRCGQPPEIAVPTQAFCGTEGCPVFWWNPHEDVSTFEATAQVVDLGVWPCMVCGEERPDAKIAVVHRDWAGMDKLPEARPFNVRYCVDRPACVAHATAEGLWTGRPEPDEGPTT